MVSLLVCMQIRFLVEALMTTRVGAGEGLLPRVDPQVRLKIEVEGEFLPALMTGVWLLSL